MQVQVVVSDQTDLFCTMAIVTLLHKRWLREHEGPRATGRRRRRPVAKRA